MSPTAEDPIDRLIDLYGKPHADADWSDVVREAAIVCYRQHGLLTGHTLSIAARMPTREGACEVIRASGKFTTILPAGPSDPADLDLAAASMADASYLEVRLPNGSHR